MRIRNYWLLRPYDAFGNRCEDIFFALLKCRREGLKLILLKRKWNLFGKVRFRHANNALLDVRHPLLVQNLLVDLLGYMLTIFWSVARILGLGWLKVSILLGSPRRQNWLLKISEVEIGRDNLWGQIHVPYKRLAGSIDWDSEWSNPLNVRFRSRDLIDATYPELAGRQYVCLHVRTGGFFNDDAYSAPRNADINNYLLAIDWLVAQGIYVVRLGGSEMPALHRDGLLDYAHSSKRSDAMDVNLVEHCIAYIGSQSGPIDLAALFEKRILTVNGYALSYNFWYRKGSLMLPKHAFLNGYPLSMRERLDQYLFEITGTGQTNPQVYYMENTPEEILFAFKEFFAITELTPLQISFNQYCEKQMTLYCESVSVWPSPWADAAQKFRLMSRFNGVRGSIANTYLEHEKWCL